LAKGNDDKIIVLGCVLAAVAVTLKIRIETPEGRQPLARAMVTNNLQAVKGELALSVMNSRRFPPPWSPPA